MTDKDGSELAQVADESKKPSKKARSFDVEALFSESRQIAQERNRETLESREVEEAETRRRLEDEMHISLPGPSGRHSDEDNEIGPPLPPSMMKSADSANDSDDEIGPPLPPNFQMPTASSSGASTSKDVEDSGLDDEDDYDDFTDEGISVAQLIPTASEATVRHGSKSVSAIAFDSQGSKFVTGGYDYHVNLYDFARMDVSLKPFRETTPVECHIISSLAYSSNGENLVVASGNAQVRLLDRKGTQWAETVRGDQYLVDLSNTKGHTGSLNGAMWNPMNKDEFMTCSDDGTLRLFNVTDYKDITKCINTQRQVIKTKTSNGKRAIPTTCCYSKDGKYIAAGCDDGSIQIWKYGKLYVNTTFLNRNAHAGSITSLQFSYEANTVLTRGLDDTLKLWDLRKFKEPIHVADGLENHYPMTECGFSPRDELVFTGTSTRPGKAPGKLVFFDLINFKPVYQIEYPNASCIRAQWHPKINQILVGLSDGTAKIYYDPVRSVRGVLQCVSKPIKRERQTEVLREEIIMSPLALQMFQPRGEEGEEKDVTEWRIKKFLRMQNTTGGKRPAFKKPAEAPMSGPSAGGRVAASGGTLHSYIAQQVGVKRNREFLADHDVRASILRHAEEAAANPIYVAKAYLKNQPVPIFQEKTTAPEDEIVDEELQPVFKMPKT